MRSITVLQPDLINKRFKISLFAAYMRDPVAASAYLFLTPSHLFLFLHLNKRSIILHTKYILVLIRFRAIQHTTNATEVFNANAAVLI